MRTFLSATSEPNTLARFVLSVKIYDFLQPRLKTAGIDTKLESAVLDKFVPWLTQAIVDLAKTRNTDVRTLLSSPDWATELEKLRRSLRSTALSAPPVSPPISGQSGSRPQKPS
jgi:hypothetical protein